MKTMVDIPDGPKCYFEPEGGVKPKTILKWCPFDYDGFECRHPDVMDDFELVDSEGNQIDDAQDMKHSKCPGLRS